MADTCHNYFDSGLHRTHRSIDYLVKSFADTQWITSRGSWCNYFWYYWNWFRLGQLRIGLLALSTALGIEQVGSGLDHLWRLCCSNRSGYLWCAPCRNQQRSQWEDCHGPYWRTQFTVANLVFNSLCNRCRSWPHWWRNSWSLLIGPCSSHNWFAS